MNMTDPVMDRAGTGAATPSNQFSPMNLSITPTQ